MREITQLMREKACKLAELLHNQTQCHELDVIILKNRLIMIDGMLEKIFIQISEGKYPTLEASTDIKELADWLAGDAKARWLFCDKHVCDGVDLNDVLYSGQQDFIDSIIENVVMGLNV